MEDVLPEHFKIICYYLTEGFAPYAGPDYEMVSLWDSPLGQAIQWQCETRPNNIPKCSKHLSYTCDYCEFHVLLPPLFRTLHALSQVSHAMYKRIDWGPFHVTLHRRIRRTELPFSPMWLPTSMDLEWLKQEPDFLNRMHFLVTLRMFGKNDERGRQLEPELFGAFLKERKKRIKAAKDRVRIDWAQRPKRQCTKTGKY